MQEKVRGVHDPRPLGAEMRSSGTPARLARALWYAVAAVLLLVVGAMPLAKGLVALG